MVLVNIRLAGDEHDRFYKAIDFDQKITYTNLKKRIYEICRIPPDYQNIRLNNTELPVVDFPLEEVESGNELVVNHVLQENWRVFLQCLESARKAMSAKLTVENEVDAASRQLKPLIECDFFVTFPNYDTIRQTFRDEFSYYLDSEYKYIEIASKAYFSILYQDNPECPNLQINCKTKQRSGVQGGLECYIYRNKDFVKKFHVKIHTRLANWHRNKGCDLRELFSYKLLETIDVGPKVHFIPNLHHSGFGLYIASEDIPDFCRECDIYEENETRNIQLELLSCCLFLGDLSTNDENYGSDGQKRLKIVDFEVRSAYQSSDDVVQKFFSKDVELRTTVGRESFSVWDLSRNIQVANHAISNQKLLLEEKCIKYKSKSLLDDYLKRIAENVAAFERYFV